MLRQLRALLTVWIEIAVQDEEMDLGKYEIGRVEKLMIYVWETVERMDVLTFLTVEKTTNIQRFLLLHRRWQGLRTRCKHLDLTGTVVESM